jgi:hypothetical protein
MMVFAIGIERALGAAVQQAGDITPLNGLPVTIARDHKRNDSSNYEFE